MLEQLKALAERLEGLNGADRETDCQVALAFGWSAFPGDNWIGPFGEIAVPNYTRSLDATVALVERVLPGWEGSISIAAGRDSWARLWTDNGITECAGDAPTAPLALLRALVAAKIAEAEHE